MSLQLTFVLGPAYSGKSEYAHTLMDPSRATTVFVTGPTSPHILKCRYDFLQSQREKISASKWKTCETPDLLASFEKSPLGEPVLIDDCYQWIKGIVLEKSKNETHSPEQIAQIINHETSRFIEHLKTRAGGNIVIVGTEIGACLPSDSPFERMLREANGKLNQSIARLANKVETLHAGIALTIKND